MPEHRQPSPAIADLTLDPEQIAELRQLSKLYFRRLSDGSSLTSREWIDARETLAAAAADLLDEVERLRRSLAEEERVHGVTVEQRDRAEQWADHLAGLLAPDDVLGEHSNSNNPWQNAAAFALTPAAEAPTETLPSPQPDTCYRCHGLGWVTDDPFGMGDVLCPDCGGAM